MLGKTVLGKKDHVLGVQISATEAEWPHQWCAVWVDCGRCATRLRWVRPLQHNRGIRWRRNPKQMAIANNRRLKLHQIQWCLRFERGQHRCGRFLPTAYAPNAFPRHKTSGTIPLRREKPKCCPHWFQWCVQYFGQQSPTEDQFLPAPTLTPMERSFSCTHPITVFLCNGFYNRKTCTFVHFQTLIFHVKAFSYKSAACTLTTIAFPETLEKSHAPYLLG